MHCLAPTARGRRRPSPPSRDLLWVGRASHFPRGVGWRIREARLRSVTHFPVTSRCWADPGLLLPLRARGLTSILRQRVSAGSVQTPGSGQMCPGPSPATGCIGGGGLLGLQEARCGLNRTGRTGLGSCRAMRAPPCRRGSPGDPGQQGAAPADVLLYTHVGTKFGAPARKSSSGISRTRLLGPAPLIHSCVT